MSASNATTWDGLPISPDPPFGTSIIVYRRAEQGRKFLILHRAQDGSAPEGDWAWTPPSGARLPNEPVDECARRELQEETGLTLPIHATGRGQESWAIYYVEISADQIVTLDVEHDRYAWVTLEEALTRCHPAVVAEGIEYVARLIQT